MVLDLHRQADVRPATPDPRDRAAGDAEAFLRTIDTATGLLASHDDAAAWTPARPANSPTSGPSSGPSIIEFRVTGGSGPARRLQLAGDRYTVGSGVGCAVRLQDASIRPLHAVLIRDRADGIGDRPGRTPPRVTVRAYSVPIDVNGSVVNESPLAVGDRLRLGEFVFERLSPSGDAAPAVASTASEPAATAPRAPAVDPAAVKRQRLRETMLADRESQLNAQHAAAAQLHAEFEGRIERLHAEQSEVRRREQELRRGHELLVDERERLRDDAVASRRALAMREKSLADRQREQAQELQQTRVRLDESRAGAEAASSELRQIRERFAKLNDQIADLSQSRDAAAQQADEARAQHAAETDRHRETAQRLGVAEEARQDAEAARQDAQSQRDSALIDRDAAVQACEQAQSQFERTQVALAEARSRADSAESTAAEHQRRLAQTEAELTRVTNQLADARQSAEQQARDAAAHRSLADDLETQLRELADQQSVHVQNHEDAAAAVTMAEIEAADSLGRLREIDSLRQRTEDELNRANAKLDAANERIAELTAANVELTGQVDQLHDLGRRTAEELVATQRSRDAAKAETDEARAETDAALAACQTAQAARDEAIETIASAESQIQRAIDEANQHRDLVATRDSQIELLRATESDLRAQSDRLQDQFDRSRADAEALREDCRRAQASIEQLQALAAEHQDRGEDNRRSFERETEQLRSEITLLTDQLTATTENFQSLQIQNDDTQARLQSVAAERQELETSLDEVREQLRSLRAEHEELQTHADQTAAQRDDAIQRANDARDAWDDSNRQHDRTLQSIESIEAATRGVIDSPADEPSVGQPTGAAASPDPWKPRLHEPAASGQPAKLEPASKPEPAGEAFESAEPEPTASTWNTVPLSDLQPREDQDDPAVPDADVDVDAQAVVGDDPWSSIRWSDDQTDNLAVQDETIVPGSEEVESTMQLEFPPVDEVHPPADAADPPADPPIRRGETGGGSRADELIRSLRQQKAAGVGVADTAPETSGTEPAAADAEPQRECSSVDTAGSSDPDRAAATERVDPDDDSIEAYMNRLLQRVQGGPAASPAAGDKPPEPAPPKSPPKTVAKPAEAIEPQPAEAIDSGDDEAKPAAQPIRARPRPPQRNHNLQAMRQLANQSARSAIHVSARSQSIDTRRRAITKFGCAAAAMACGLVALVLVFGMLKYIAAAAAVLLGGVWFKEGVTLWFSAMKPPAEQPAPEQSTPEQPTPEQPAPSGA